VPAARDPFFDVVRALGLMIVVVGHWLTGGFALVPDGTTGERILTVVNPLNAIPGSAPLTWTVGVLGVFFLVGGRLSALSWQRAVARRQGYGSWLGGRVAGLARPALGVVALLALAGGVALWSGVPTATIWSLVAVALSPLWFLGVYFCLTALTPALVALDRRFGWWATVLLALVVALVDVTRFSPWAPLAPDGLAWLALRPGWGVPFHLGRAWSTRRPGRRAAAAVTAGAGAGLLALVGLAGYSPVLTMAGGCDPTKSQTHPPSLAIVAALLAWCGACWLLEPLIRRHAARWAEAPLVAWTTRHPVAILAWHQALACLLTCLMAWLIPQITVFGLFGLPTGGAWLAARATWLAVPVVAVLALRRLRVGAGPSQLGRLQGSALKAHL
jgi:hypothetical protein